MSNRATVVYFNGIVFMFREIFELRAFSRFDKYKLANIYVGNALL